MNKTVKVRVTAAVLLVWIVISCGIGSVFAETTQGSYSEDSEQENSTEPNISDAAMPDLSGNIYRIRNVSRGEYLTLAEIDSEIIPVLSASDTEDSAQYFRTVSGADGTYKLNSANSGASYSLTVKELYEFDASENSRLLQQPNADEENEEAELEKEYILSATETRDATGFEISFSDSGENASVTVTLDENIYYLTFTDEGAALSLDGEGAYEWVFEEVNIESLSMAYFETRVKLYSVQQFFAKVTPSAISSFIEWSVDDESIMMVSADGTVCALAEGEAVLTAKVGNASYSCRTEICDSEAFTWFSQENVTSSYWNGGALSGIRFSGRVFASDSARDWMRQGCALTCCAMLFRNLGATYENGYDFRSGQHGNLPADPYTLALANVKHSGFTSPVANYRADPVLVRWSNITDAFKVDGRSLSYSRVYTSSLAAIRDALASHPEGVVVCMQKSNGATHYVLFTECINPEETRASKLKFIIYDPMSADGSDGDGVLFEDSASYKDGYRYSSITNYLVWNVN